MPGKLDRRGMLHDLALHTAATDDYKSNQETRFTKTSPMTEVELEDRIDSNTKTTKNHAEDTGMQKALGNASVSHTCARQTDNEDINDNTMKLKRKLEDVNVDGLRIEELRRLLNLMIGRRGNESGTNIAGYLERTRQSNIYLAGDLKRPQNQTEQEAFDWWKAVLRSEVKIPCDEDADEPLFSKLMEEVKIPAGEVDKTRAFWKDIQSKLYISDEEIYGYDDDYTEGGGDEVDDHRVKDGEYGYGLGYFTQREENIEKIDRVHQMLRR